MGRPVIAWETTSSKWRPSSSTPLRRESLLQTAGRRASCLALSICACASSIDVLENALHGGVDMA